MPSTTAGPAEPPDDGALERTADEQELSAANTMSDETSTPTDRTVSLFV